MKKIREEIKQGMALCDREIRKACEEIIPLQERQNLFDDRKQKFAICGKSLRIVEKVSN